MAKAKQPDIGTELKDLILKQGWNSDSLYILILRFIEEQKLDEDFMSFMKRAAREENASYESIVQDTEANEYTHLTIAQYEKIKDLAIEMEMAGNGETTVSKEEATRTMKGLLICDMLDRMGYDEDGRQDRICKRLGFNPETGKAE